MQHFTMSKDKVRELKNIPVIVGCCHPFRLILRKEDNWNPSLADINARTYDYVKLNRMSTYIDIGINPLSLGVGFDGSLILPGTKDFFTREKAVEKFNEILGMLLLGGIYYEAVHPTDISFGTLTFDGYVRLKGGMGSVLDFHSAARSKVIGSMDVIRLFKPMTITIENLETAYVTGKEIFKKISGLSPNILLSGTSKYVRREWAESLIFLWTAVEQLINILWTAHVLNGKTEKVIEGRKDFLKDFRSWTSSNRIELLFQKGVLPIDIYQLLNSARKTRNDFIHNGKRVEEKNVKPALEGLFNLIAVCTNTQPSQANVILEAIYQHQREDIIPERQRGEMTHFLPLPPIPGDPEWGDKEYEIIDDLMLRPLKKSL